MPATVWTSSATTSLFEGAPMIAFYVPGSPVAFARSGGNGTIRFTPKRQRDFMALVRLAAAKAMDGGPPMAGPVAMTVKATYLVPKSWPKKRVAAARWRTAKPDADNLAKLVADSINEIVYVDDAQVAELVVQKRYGPLAGVTVSVAPLDEGGAE
jgi:Holliday junction resolvase RusA-like endonuclease